VAKEAAKNYESVRDVVKRRGLLPEDQLDEVLDVREMTEPGIPGGG
jgi:fumarate hydratase class II